jgi:hypothetical protein
MHEYSALFHLHSEDAPVGPVATISAHSSLALKTAARMVVDIAHNFNNTLAKLGTLNCPPTYCYLVYRATMELISLHDSMDQTQWSHDLETLRQASWHYGRRWQVAGRTALSPISYRYLV